MQVQDALLVWLPVVCAQGRRLPLSRPIWRAHGSRRRCRRRRRLAVASELNVELRMARVQCRGTERLQGAVLRSHNWSAQGLYFPCRGRCLIDAVRSVQLLNGKSIIVFSMWKLELGQVGWHQGRKAARREVHRQSHGNKKVAGRQTVPDLQNKECLSGLRAELKGALCSML
jgi:hypothetical protein